MGFQKYYFGIIFLKSKIEKRIIVNCNGLHYLNTKTNMLYNIMVIYHLSQKLKLLINDNLTI